MCSCFVFKLRRGIGFSRSRLFLLQKRYGHAPRENNWFPLKFLAIIAVPDVPAISAVSPVPDSGKLLQPIGSDVFLLVVPFLLFLTLVLFLSFFLLHFVTAFLLFMLSCFFRSAVSTVFPSTAVIKIPVIDAAFTVYNAPAIPFFLTFPDFPVVPL